MEKNCNIAYMTHTYSTGTILKDKKSSSRHLFDQKYKKPIILWKNYYNSK